VRGVEDVKFKRGASSEPSFSYKANWAMRVDVVWISNFHPLNERLHPST